jgi:hypothetical protein
MRSSGGGPTLDVSHAGMATVAATMTSAAGSLAALAAVPPVHAPLAADEVSTSAAARLTEHGGVLSSRASDGAAVLAAAAQTVLAVATQMAEIDAANAAGLAALGGQISAPVGGLAAPAAVKANAMAAATPITPMAPRPGEVTAGLIETGSSSTGTTFQGACRAYGSAFEACAVAARGAQSAVAAGVTGRTGPRLSAALNKFASWADAMASHSATLAQSAQEHGGRFDRTQHDTPRTQQFTDTRQSLTRAQMLNLKTGGMASGLVAQYAGQLQQLDSTATAAGVSYHLTELPQAPPPPPPVTDIVADGSPAPTDGSGQPGDEKPDKSGDSHDGAQTDPAGLAPGSDALPGAPGSDGDPLGGVAADPLLGGDAAGSAMGGDPMQQIAPMAAMLPSALAGALGGAMGAVTSVPQQVMGAAQQIMQGASSSMEKPEDLGLGGDPLSDTGLSDLGSGGLGSGGGGGGGGGTEPAGLDTSLPPGGGALAAASAPSGGAPPVLASSGAVHAPTTAAPAGAGMGMGMMPPMMGGMGAGGAGGAGRTPTPPDKTVVIPSIPNGEPVKGEVERRQTASVDDAATGKAESGDPAAAGRPRRRVVVSAPPEGESK